VTFAVDRGPIATIRCCPVLYDATMIFDEARQLVEADRHICDAHRAIQHQRKTVAELKASGKPSHAANALLALMILMLPLLKTLYHFHTDLNRKWAPTLHRHEGGSPSHPACDSLETV